MNGCLFRMLFISTKKEFFWAAEWRLICGSSRENTVFLFVRRKASFHLFQEARNLNGKAMFLNMTLKIP